MTGEADDRSKGVLRRPAKPSYDIFRTSATAAREGPDEATVRAPVVSQPSASVAGDDVVLGRYRLRRRLGAGGFGTVYEAEDLRLGRLVALKLIHGAPGASDRIRREAMAAARLDHPGIVALFDAGEDGDTRFLVSELVEGRTLAELETAGELSDRDVLRIGLALADALAHAHARGVIHRDLKPQNVIVPSTDGGTAPGEDTWRAAAKLADFGVASLAGDEPLTQTGDVVGTLAYMAPEQAAGERVDERADVYALALVLYEALTGVNPVRAGSPAATARRVGTVLPPLRHHRRDLPPDVAAVIDAALDPRPDRRPDIADLADGLASALPVVPDAGGFIAPHPLERGWVRAPRGTRRALAALAAAGLAAALLAELAPRLEPAPIAVAAMAAALVFVIPRLGWIVAMTGICLLIGSEPGRGTDALPALAAALIAPPLLLRSSGWAWSLPVAAPLLGAVLLAPAYPALAGRAPGLRERVALGALGAWWLLLAELLLDRRLLHGIGAEGALTPPLAVAALGLGLLWAVAAGVLPMLVRGRSRALDTVAAILWAGGLVAGTVTVGESSGLEEASEPGGLLAAGLLAVVVAAWRRG